MNEPTEHTCDMDGCTAPALVCVEMTEPNAEPVHLHACANHRADATADPYCDVVAYLDHA